MTENRWQLLAVSAALAVAALVHGVTIPLLALVLDGQGVSSTLIGLSTGTQFLSVFVIAPLAPRLLRAPGPGLVMLWSIVATVALLIALGLLPNVYVWFLLRFLLGTAEGLIWIAGEAWINEATEERSRGRVLSMYGVAVAAGFAVGPLILAFTGAAGLAPFFLSAVISGLAALPLLFVVNQAPKLEGLPTASFWGYLFLAPTAMFVFFAFAMANAIVLTFLPIYATMEGLDQRTGVVLLTVLSIGSIVFRFPLGWLTDHMDRLLLTGLSLLAMCVATAILAIAIGSSPWNYVLIFVFGGIFGGLYTLPMVLLGQQFKGADLAVATTVFNLMYHIGSMVGPPIGGLGVEIFGSDGVVIVTGAVLLMVAPLPLISWMRRLGTPRR